MSRSGSARGWPRRRKTLPREPPRTGLQNCVCDLQSMQRVLLVQPVVAGRGHDRVKELASPHRHGPRHRCSHDPMKVARTDHAFRGCPPKRSVSALSGRGLSGEAGNFIIRPAHQPNVVEKDDGNHHVVRRVGICIGVVTSPGYPCFKQLYPRIGIKVNEGAGGVPRCQQDRGSLDLSGTSGQPNVIVTVTCPLYAPCVRRRCP
jgi:hypothetical protein